MTHAAQASAVLDAYPSILSGDSDGKLAELYFTNTHIALLAVSLASGVAMNLLLTSLALTFAGCSAAGKFKHTLPFMALHRAGRFLWSDTPFG